MKSALVLQGYRTPALPDTADVPPPRAAADRTEALDEGPARADRLGHPRFLREVLLLPLLLYSPPLVASGPYGSDHGSCLGKSQAFRNSL